MLKITKTTKLYLALDKAYGKDTFAFDAEFAGYLVELLDETGTSDKRKIA